MNSSITDSHLRSNDFSAIVKSQVREILNLSRGIWNKQTHTKKKKLVNSVTRGEKQADRQQSRVFSLTGQQQQKQEEDVVLT